MRWDLYLVSENAALRIRPQTAVHMLKTLLTDGRVTKLEEQEDPESRDDDEHIRFTGAPNDSAHTIFYEGPKMTPQAAFERMEVEIFSAPRFVPGTEADEDAERYWFWVRLVGAQFNFISENFSERLENAFRMKARPVPRPMT